MKMMPNSFSPIIWQLHLQPYFSSKIFCFSSLICVEDCKVVISLLSNDQIFYYQENLDAQIFLDRGIKSSIDVVTHHNKQPYHRLVLSRWWYVAIRETKINCFCFPFPPNIIFPLLIFGTFILRTHRQTTIGGSMRLLVFHHDIQQMTQVKLAIKYTSS